MKIRHFMLGLVALPSCAAAQTTDAYSKYDSAGTTQTKARSAPYPLFALFDASLVDDEKAFSKVVVRGTTLYKDGANVPFVPGTLQPYVKDCQYLAEKEDYELKLHWKCPSGERRTFRFILVGGQRIAWVEDFRRPYPVIVPVSAD